MRLFEKYYPFIFAILFSLALRLYLRPFMPAFDILIPNIANSSLTIAGTLFGFLLTILTIINTISTRRMQFIKDAGYYPKLVSYLNKAILANIAVIGYSFIQFFLKRDKINLTSLEIFDYIFIFLTVFNILLTTRFAYIFIQLISDTKPK